jgi:hypothetical protein
MVMNHKEQKHPRPGLDLKMREMLTVAVLTVLGYSQAELKEHIINFIKYARKPQAFKPGDEWHPFGA